MKYVIFPVWAHVCKTVSDEFKVANDMDIEIEMRPLNDGGAIVIFERLARSYSVSGDLMAHAIEADRLQCEYDDAAEPIRVYVFEVVPGQRYVPVYAARQRCGDGTIPRGRMQCHERA